MTATADERTRTTDRWKALNSKLDVISKIVVLSMTVVVPALLYGATAYLDNNYASAEEASNHVTVETLEKAKNEIMKDRNRLLQQIICLMDKDVGARWINDSCQYPKGMRPRKTGG